MAIKGLGIFNLSTKQVVIFLSLLLYYEDRSMWWEQEARLMRHRVGLHDGKNINLCPNQKQNVIF